MQQLQPSARHYQAFPRLSPLPPALRVGPGRRGRPRVAAKTSAARPRPSPAEVVCINEPVVPAPSVIIHMHGRVMEPRPASDGCMQIGRPTPRRFARLRQLRRGRAPRPPPAVHRKRPVSLPPGGGGTRPLCTPQLCVFCMPNDTAHRPTGAGGPVWSE